jgi:hypothetical protein
MIMKQLPGMVKEDLNLDCGTNTDLSHRGDGRALSLSRYKLHLLAVVLFPNIFFQHEQTPESPRRCGQAGAQIAARLIP